MMIFTKDNVFREWTEEDSRRFAARSAAKATPPKPKVDPAKTRIAELEAQRGQLRQQVETLEKNRSRAAELEAENRKMRRQLAGKGIRFAGGCGFRIFGESKSAKAAARAAVN